MTSLEAHFIISLANPLVVCSVSGSVEALLGFLPNDFVVGEVTLQSRIHADDQDLAERLFDKSSVPSSGDFPIRLRKVNGRICIVRLFYSKTAVESTGDIQLTLLIQDVISLFASQSQKAMTIEYRSMLENTDDFVFFKNRNHVLTGASQTLASICPPAKHWKDLIGQTDYEIFPEKYADKFYQLEKDVYRGVKVANEIQEYETRDGKRGWVDNRKYPIRDDNNEIVGLFGVSRDITERKYAEIALQESHQQMKLLLESMAEGAFGIDTNGLCTFVNESFAQILGYSKSEVVGHKIHDLIHYSHPDGTPYPESECRINVAYKCNENIHCTKEVFWHKFGVPIPVEYWSRPIVVDGNILGAVTTFIDVSERRMAEERMQHKATYDALCDLPNRDLLEDRLKQTLLNAHRDKLQFGLIFIDLDEFKPINDTYGHSIGDQVLSETARRMQACVRASDTVARIGGDEFIILLPVVDSGDDVLLVAEKVRESLNRPMMLADLELNISCSIGIALFPEHGSDEMTLIKNADAALYIAKRLGRNNVQMFRPQGQ